MQKEKMSRSHWWWNENGTKFLCKGWHKQMLTGKKELMEKRETRQKRVPIFWKLEKHTSCSGKKAVLRLANLSLQSSDRHKSYLHLHLITKHAFGGIMKIWSSAPWAIKTWHIWMHFKWRGCCTESMQSWLLQVYLQGLWYLWSNWPNRSSFWRPGWGRLNVLLSVAQSGGGCEETSCWLYDCWSQRRSAGPTKTIILVVMFTISGISFKSYGTWKNSLMKMKSSFTMISKKKFSWSINER